MKLLYDIASLTLASLIVIFSLITVRFGIAYLLITKIKRQYDWIVLLQTMIGVAWTIIFGYILEESIFDYTPIVQYSFGSLFIRPVILISACAVAIWMYIRYMFEKSGRSDDQWNLLKKQ